MWMFWALLSAVLVASRRPFEKKIIGKLHHFLYGFVIQALSLPVLAGVLLANRAFLNPLTLGVKFWLPVLVVSVGFYPLSAYLYKVAIKDGELSKVLPLQSLGPVCALMLAWVTLGEVPAFLAAMGLVVTVAGVYVLGLKGRRLHHPLQPFREDGSSRAMLLQVMLVVAVGILDKVAMQASNPLFYGFASSVGATMTLLVALCFARQRIWTDVMRHAPRLLLISGLQASTYMTYLLAVAAGPIAYVSALRGSNILMGSLLGILIFKEKFTKQKKLAFVLIVAGAALLTAGAA